MTQRRTPSGQGPTRRPTGQAGRPGVRNGARPGRVRDTGATRIEPRRIPTARTTGSVNRSGSRPAAARRAAASGATKRTVATRPKAFTGRATVLIIVLVALALAYTYPVRVYLAQESQIAQMQADQAAQQAKIKGLEEEVDKWKDKEYVRIQARDRLFYVKPGEVPLLVLNDPAGAARDAAGTAAPGPDRWYDTLWGSVAAANAESRK
ncbi:FtsB family cell division protein [Couchioplanes caeruleus]|uniref:Septation ring formation regulator EzrA n=2 Tax=Couchioplanes caeruleus TaxID=56438 RepID=A0A1K0FPC3_9ACTN|nr:septum formation initiator family protein [Couchioplanes caeruleus]OJF14693.1 septation ring formation regulator EzrA [Couchioplanes caeruleus subsp. caeruleus]ROP30095.1 cell division protein FtsB [Couchioplanes caeruleus]